MTLELKEPVKATPSKYYLAVLEDAHGVTHFWLRNGKYDGHSRPYKKKYPRTSDIYYKMFGGHCRRVRLLSPTRADEHPYDVSKMTPCDDPEHDHK